MNRTVQTLLKSLGLAVASFFTVGQAHAFAPKPMRIMPYGDSLTAGAFIINNVFNTGAGYRGSLWRSLTNADISTQFVGSLSDGGSPDFPQPHHEGHSGKRIDEIAANAHAWVTSANPDVVLLLIGTNDCIQNYDMPNAVSRLAGLVQQIELDAPKADVFVSTTIPHSNLDVNNRVIAYNAELTKWAEAKAHLDRKLHYVDLFTNAHIRNGLDGGPSDLIDGVHPTPEGYQSMALVWYQAIMRSLF